MGAVLEMKTERNGAPRRLNSGSRSQIVGFMRGVLLTPGHVGPTELPRASQ